MITYRRLKWDDLPACAKILETKETKCFTGEYPTVDYLSHIMIDEMSFVAVNGSNEIVGCIFSEKLKCFGALLDFMAVREDQRKRGLGTNLLKVLQAEYATKHIEWMILYSTTSSEVNKSFYTKNGFIDNGSFYEMGKLI